MKKFVVIVLLLCLASISYGAVGVVADFETGTDNFNLTWENAVTLSTTTTGATSGIQALEVNPVDTYTSGFLWVVQWDEISHIAAAQAGPNPRLVADVTVIPSEWASEGGDWDIWLQLEKVAIQGDTLSWTEFLPDDAGFSVYGEQATADIHQKTITWDLSSLDWSTVPTPQTWAQIVFATNFGVNVGPITSIGNFYFDNVRIETDDPIVFSPWTRYECEDAELSYPAYIVDDADCSGGQNVSIQKDGADMGAITITVNAPQAGTYNMRYGQWAYDLERYEDFYVNDVEIIDQQFAGNIEWPVEDAVGTGATNDWDDQTAAIQELFDSVVLYGEEDGNWQIWSRWAPAWNFSMVNEPMTVDLLEGKNTISIVAVWGWDNWDYVEVELGYIPKNPSPADGSIAVMDLATELTWQNALGDLDKVEVWFGETPEYNELDPNSVVTKANYKTILALEAEITDPGASLSISMPSSVSDGQDYTWIVDGFKNVPDGGDPNYPGVFWTFQATDNAPPTADAGEDQYVWLDPNSVVVTLDGSASDDGETGPPPGQVLSFRWTQLAGPAVTIDDPNAMTTTVTITELGNTNEPDTADPYEFELTVTEEEDAPYWVETDTVMVYVNSNSCLSTQEHPDGYLFYGDITGPEGTADQMVPDCKVDLYDFYEIALNWLNCSNLFEVCP